MTLRRAFQFSLLVSIRDGTTRRTISRRTIWSAIVIGVSNPSHTPPSSHALKKLAVENHFYVAISSLSLSFSLFDAFVPTDTIFSSSILTINDVRLKSEISFQFRFVNPGRWFAIISKNNRIHRVIQKMFDNYLYSEKISKRFSQRFRSILKFYEDSLISKLFDKCFPVRGWFVGWLDIQEIRMGWKTLVHRSKR